MSRFTDTPTADAPVDEKVDTTADAPVDEKTDTTADTTAEKTDTPTADAPVEKVSQTDRRETAEKAWSADVTTITAGSDPDAAATATLFGAVRNGPSFLDECVGRSLSALFADPTTAGTYAAIVVTYASTVRAAIPTGSEKRPVDTRAATIDRAATARAIRDALHAAASAIHVDLPADVTADESEKVGSVPESIREAIDRLSGRVSRALDPEKRTRSADGASRDRPTIDPDALTVGTVLSHGDFSCEVVDGADGAVAYRVNGTDHASLTAAARAVNGGTAVNGRAYWKVAADA